MFLKSEESMEWVWLYVGLNVWRIPLLPCIWNGRLFCIRRVLVWFNEGENPSSSFLIHMAVYALHLYMARCQILIIFG